MARITQEMVAMTRVVTALTGQLSPEGARAAAATLRTSTFSNEITQEFILDTANTLETFATLRERELEDEEQFLLGVALDVGVGFERWVGPFASQEAAREYGVEHFPGRTCAVDPIEEPKA